MGRPSTNQEEIIYRKNVAAKIRSCRRALDLTQDDVAERLGITRAMVGHWENARATISPSHIHKLAQLLKTDFDVFGKNAWSETWPQKCGAYWFYGIRYSTDSVGMYAAEVKGNGSAYVCDGKFMCIYNAHGVWMPRVNPPDPEVIITRNPDDYDRVCKITLKGSSSQSGDTGYN